MKLNGHATTLRTTSQVELPRPNGHPWPLTLQPLPLGFYRRLRLHQVTPPLRPTRIARDSQGKPLRDQQGVAVVIHDDQHPDYLNQLDLYHQRVAVLMLREALAADPQIEFETPQPKGADTDWQSYADQIYAEFEQAGFAAGDLMYLCDHVARLSNLIDEHLQGAHANFSLAPPAATS